jgi:hypothetical protein
LDIAEPVFAVQDPLQVFCCSTKLAEAAFAGRGGWLAVDSALAHFHAHRHCAHWKVTPKQDWNHQWGQALPDSSCCCASLCTAGVKLEPEQIQKIEAEAAVLAEIKELGGTA